MKNKNIEINLFCENELSSIGEYSVIWRVLYNGKLKIAGVYNVSIPLNVSNPRYWAQAHVLWEIMFYGFLETKTYYNMKYELNITSNSKKLVYLLNIKPNDIEKQEVLRKDGGYARCVRFYHPFLTSFYKNKEEWKDEIKNNFLCRKIVASYDIEKQVEPISFQIKDIGLCVLTPHAFFRFLQNEKFNELKNESKLLPMSLIKKTLLSARWKEITFPKRILSSKLKKYQKVARYYLKSNSDLFLTLTAIDEQRFAIKTVFWMNPKLGIPI